MNRKIEFTFPVYQNIEENQEEKFLFRELFFCIINSYKNVYKRNWRWAMNTQFIKGLSIDWNRIAPYSYLREIEALHDLKNLEFTSPITFFVGENGSGKSTLLEAIAIAAGFNPEGGSSYQIMELYMNKRKQLLEWLL